jgi:riboflavin kinase
MAFKTRGEVTSGLGKGREFVTLDGYVDQFLGKLGYEPYPGTLNVELESETDGAFDELDAIRIDGWEDGDRSFGIVDCYPADISRPRTESDVPLHVLVPDRSDHDSSVIEIIAPVRLRDEFGLSDGASIEVRIESFRGHRGA